jgi:hypothetical protein
MMKRRGFKPEGGRKDVCMKLDFTGEGAKALSWLPRLWQVLLI